MGHGGSGGILTTDRQDLLYPLVPKPIIRTSLLGRETNVALCYINRYMQISNSKLCEASKCRIFIKVNHSLVDENTFPATEFAVA